MSSHDSTLEFDYESTARAELVAASVARETREFSLTLGADGGGGAE